MKLKCLIGRHNYEITYTAIMEKYGCCVEFENVFGMDLKCSECGKRISLVFHDYEMDKYLAKKGEKHHPYMPWLK